MNNKLHIKYGWDEWVVKRCLGVSPDADLDSLKFLGAVKDFQSQHGLKQDGLFGPKTYGVFRVVCNLPNQEDIDRLEDLLIAEAGGAASEFEALCVAQTVINRIKRKPSLYGYSIDEVVSGGAYAVRSRRPIKEKHNEYAQLAEGILFGLSVDPTIGCTHFFSPRNMPRRGAVRQWEGKESALSGSHYYEMDNGRIVLYRKEKDLMVFTSAKGGWHKVFDAEGQTHTVAFPGFANSDKMEYVEIDGVRPWFFMFYRYK